jgi:ribonuclease III
VQYGFMILIPAVSFCSAELRECFQLILQASPKRSTKLPELSLSDVDQILDLCEVRIGYRFTDRRLLRRCLTHSSSAETRLDSNERLEFLGDAVLGLVICESLFQSYPDLREGQLTQMKSQLVSRTVCARVAHKLDLRELILVGRGLSSIPESVMSAVVESLIAGIYEDGGLDAARKFIVSSFADELLLCRTQATENYKSLLQERTQRGGSVTPEYIVIEERGPDHAREFCVVARVGAVSYLPAWGKSKKEAEQQAARQALEVMSADESSQQPETD